MKQESLYPSKEIRKEIRTIYIYVPQTPSLWDIRAKSFPDFLFYSYMVLFRQNWLHADEYNFWKNLASMYFYLLSCNEKEWSQAASEANPLHGHNLARIVGKINPHLSMLYVYCILHMTCACILYIARLKNRGIFLVKKLKSD